MTARIQCECGKVHRVDPSVGLTCECGRTLPSPATVSRSSSSSSVPATAGANKARSTLLDEHSMVLTSSQEVRQRMDLEACGKFVGRLHQMVHAMFDGLEPQTPRVLQIAYALVPGKPLVLDIQSAPGPLPGWQRDRLTQELQQLRRPLVESGPVAFVACIPVGETRRLKQLPTFAAPFMTQARAKRYPSLDAMLMEAAGLAWRPRGYRLRSAGVWLLRRWRAVPGARWLERFALSGFQWCQRRLRGSRVPVQLHGRLEQASIDQLDRWIEEYPRATGLVLRRGEKFHSAGRWSEAIRDFDRYLERWPKDATVHVRRGEAHCNQREVQRGLADFDRALQLDSENVAARMGRATVYLELNAWSAAIEDINRALEVNPRTARLYLMRALARLGDRDFDGAMRDLDECLDRDPYSWEAFARRAMTRQETLDEATDVEEVLGRVEDDLSCFLESKPAEAAPWAQRAEIRLRQGRVDDALRDCDAAIELDEQYGWAYGLRSVAHRLRERWDEAMCDSDRAIELGVRSADVYLTRAMSHSEAGDTERAILDCDEAIEINADHPGPVELRGVLRLEQGEAELAVEDFTRMLELGGDAGRGHLNRANAHRLGGDLELAIRDYDRAIEFDGELATAYLNRALAWEQLDELGNAIDDASRAIEVDSTLATAFDLRARFRSQQDMDSLATEDWNEAVNLDKSLAPAFFNRGHHWMKLNEPERALEDFEHLTRLLPDWPLSHTSRGGALLRLQRDAEGTEAFERAAELDPESAEEFRLQRLWMQGYTHRECERYAEAIELANEILSEAPTHRATLELRAGAYWYNDQFVEAFEDYDALVTAHEDSANLWQCRGYVQAELGEYTQSLSDFKKATELLEDDARVALKAYVLNGMGLALLGLERVDEAEDAFDQSLELEPDNGWLHYNRGLLHHQSGDVSKAVVEFRASLQAEHPRLSPGKRRRAEGYVERYGSQSATDESSRGDDSDGGSSRGESSGEGSV